MLQYDIYGELTLLLVLANEAAMCVCVLSHAYGLYCSNKNL